MQALEAMETAAASMPPHCTNAFLHGQMRVLEMIATDAPLGDTLDALLSLIEAQESHLHCAMLVAGDDSGHFHCRSGPRQPDGHLLHGTVAIAPPYPDPSIQAAHQDTVIDVPDVSHELRWGNAWRDTVLSSGLRTCRATPVHAADGSVLGVFASYGEQPGDPAVASAELMATATRLATIALQRAHVAATRKREESQLAELLGALPVAVYRTDVDGRITYYNEAAATLAGRRPKLGSDEWCVTWRLYAPDGTRMPHAQCPMAMALKENRAIIGAEATAERPDGTRVPFLAYPVPLRDASGAVTGALNTLVDITGRKHAEQSLQRQTQRLKALNDIARSVASDLDLERIVQAVTDSATQLSGARFGAFFYNASGEQGEHYELFALSGAPRAAFEKFGTPRNSSLFGRTFRGEGIVRCDDVHADPRYGRNAPYHGMPKGHLPVVSYLAVPVISRSGEVLGGMFFGHDLPGIFTEDTEELVTGIATHTAIAIDNARLMQDAQREIAERRAAEAHRKLLLLEVNHRAKNTLATVQSIAVQTLHNAQSPQAFEEAFLSRLAALSHTHDLLTRSNWRGASLADLAARELAPYRGNGEAHWRLSGEAVELDARTALALGMVLHELATNAGKYGALSTTAGQVELVWRVDAATPGDTQAQLHLEWTERNGPQVVAPQRRGFGSRLIKDGLAYELDATVCLEFPPSGVRCTIDMALAAGRVHAADTDHAGGRGGGDTQAA